MTVVPLNRPTVCQRRRARRLAYWNGGAWAMGNGLASTTLVLYLAMELDVPGIGLAISLILAAPRLAGLLRLAAPALIARMGSRKWFCLGAYLLSALVLSGLPVVAAGYGALSLRQALAALVVLWCSYHLLEYLGTVALWSWLADLAPLRIRGRFLGRRERWMVTGQAVAMLCGGLHAWGWRYLHPSEPRSIAYAIPAALGTAFMVAALAPLAGIPALGQGVAVRPGATVRAMVAPLADRRFVGLLLFGCFLSAANGLTQLAQGVYPYWVLGMGLFTMLALRTGMRLGQFAISPWLGRLADRLGNKPVMAISLLLIAQGPLCFLLATPERPWWLAGAWGFWVAWAGVNVCLPNLILKLSPERTNAAHIATYYAVTGFCLAASTVLGGGVLFDRFRYASWTLPGGIALDFYQATFLFGWVARLVAAVLLLLLVVEPRGNRR